MSQDIQANTNTSGLALLISGTVSLIVIAFIYAFATWGGDFVNSLSSEIGEVVALRATDLAASGQINEAIAGYESALTRRFEDEPTQRIYAMQRLARLCLQTGKTTKAIGVMEAAFQLDPTYGPSYFQLFEALLANKQNERALAVTRAWFDTVKASGDTSAQAWAKYNEGVLHRNAENWAAALTAFSESHTIKPMPDNAMQCAYMQAQLGQSEAARASADEVIATGDERFTVQAKALRDSLLRQSSQAR